MSVQTPQPITEWLEKLGLGQYAQRFIENEIDVSVLRHLTDQDLKDIGVPLGHRRKILAAISEAAGAIASPPETAVVPKPHDIAERRQVTVMFSDLVGSTALSERMDPEDLREVISAYQKRVSETVERFGGFVAKYMGDGVLVYFGYPQAHEDDAERAVRASLELVAAVGQLNSATPLQVRIGIATGLVVIGDLVGSGEAQERGIVGETPNLAARLQSIAVPNTVLIAEGTRELIGNLFQLEDLGARHLKGISRPVKAWVAVNPSLVESRFEALRTTTRPLVGRDQELELLMERWTQAKEGSGCVVLISGEPGIGKSRLTQAFQERLAAEQHTHLRFFCSPHHQDSALHPVIVQLERTVGFRREDGPETKLAKLEALLDGSPSGREQTPLIAELLSLHTAGRYPPVRLTPQKRKEKTFDALLARITTIAERKPVFVLFEDVHWIDPSSLELLSMIVKSASAHRMLLLITARPEFTAPWPKEKYVALPLARLGRREGTALAENVAGNKALPEELLTQILSRTDGVPLFLEELTKTVLESGLLREERDFFVLARPLQQLAIPTTLHASLLARLDRLAPVRSLAQLAAALGRQFSHQLISSVASVPNPQLLDSLNQLVASELIFRRGTPPDAEYTFKHALVQDAAYSTLLRSQRQQLHARIATTIEREFPDIVAGQPEVLARHCTEAGMSEAAIKWWRQAGEMALRRSAFAEAITHFDNAIGLAEGVADGPASRFIQLQLQIAKGNALIASRGHHAHATTAAFARARELAAKMEDRPERFSAYYGVWVGSFTRAELALAKETAEAFLRDAARKPDSPEAGIAHRSYGMTCWFEGDFVRAREHSEKVLSIYNRERDRELAFKFGQDYGITAMSFLALVVWPLGEVDRARRLADEAVALALREGHVPTLYLVRNVITASLEMIRGDSARAMPHLEASFNLAREHGMQLPLLTAAYGLAWARWHAGLDHAAGVQAEMRERRALIRKIHYFFLDPLYATLLADVEAGAGNVNSALELVDETLSEAEKSGQVWYDAELHRTRGELLLKTKPADIAAAETAFKRAIGVARSQQTKAFELRASLSLAKLYHGECRKEPLSEVLLPALVGFRISPEIPEVEEANRLLAMVTRPST
jgi:class 3 adenylate cyclase/predicted ATPase